MDEQIWNLVRRPLPHADAQGLDPAYGPILSTGRAEIDGVVFSRDNHRATAFTLNFAPGTTLASNQKKVAALMPSDAAPRTAVVEPKCARELWDWQGARDLLGPAPGGSSWGPFAAYFSGPVGAASSAFRRNDVSFANISFATSELLPPCGP